MFALRAAMRSSLWATAARRPAFYTRPMSGFASDFLSDAEPDAGPSSFELPDEPPTAGGNAFPRGGAPHAPLVPASNKPRYRLHCHSSRNNTIVTLTKPNGGTIAWASGGSCGFKKSNRAGYEAGYTCAKNMFSAILKEQRENCADLQLELFFKGFGEGREALKTAILGAEGVMIRPLVTKITDRTPIKIGGTRSKKTRRV